MSDGPVARVRVTWAGGHRFDTSRPGGPIARLDGTAETGQSPVDAVLSALATCSGIDVVDIMEKRRTPVEDLIVEVNGQRTATHPRRLTHIWLKFHADGEGVDRAHAERAVELSLTKYCSVAASLDPHIPITYVVMVNGETGPERQAARGEEATPAASSPS